MLSTESYFPRGGYSTKENEQKTSTKEHVSKHEESEKLFGASYKSKKQRKQDQTNTIDLEPFSMSHSIVPDHVDALTYQKIQDGMLLLGCVKHVTTMNGVQVQLPSRCFGGINIQDISYEYTKYLADLLEADTDAQNINKPFQSGDFIPVKVLLKTTEDKGFRIMLSSKPEFVNANIQFNKLSQGMILWASIIERSDHCYILNVGIPRCRVVLPFKKSEADYFTGQSVWCVVQQANIEDQASILAVSTMHADIQKASVKNNTSLDALTPGMTITFKIEKVLKDGLRGSICKNCTAFIESSNLSKIKGNPQNYKIGQKLNATLLYVQQTTKFCYLTLQSTATAPAPTIPIGTKLNGKVLASRDRGIHISLTSDARGFIPFNRLHIRQNSKKKTNEPTQVLQRIIAEAYPTNAACHVRVIDYNYMERTYICTNKHNEINEKYFAISDFKIGDIVKANIKEIKTNGVVVSVGKVQGFIPNIHLCDIQFSETIKSNLKINQKVSAKVLNTKPNNVYFTLKKSLISNDLNLSSADKIDTTSCYPGVVVKISHKLIHVQFYGGFSGRLKMSDFQNQQNIADMFFIGQVVTTRILTIEDDVPILTIHTNVDDHKETAKKKKKKRVLNESSSNNENAKKAKVEDINITGTDSNDITDTDESTDIIEQPIQPILKKAKKKKNVEKKLVEEEIIQNGHTDEPVLKKRKSTISFAEEPLVKTFNKSARPDPTAKCNKPLAIRGVSDFFATTSLRLDSDSDSDEEEVIIAPKKSKKKQSAAEKREKDRHEEERLRALETQLADNSSIPQSAEQFDRMLLGQPNSSKLWSQYIAFHMQSIEIEKARSIARKALDTISQTHTQERLNMWTVFLNLEHEFGTKDSYDELFQEALIRNNSLPIYLLSIENHVSKDELVEADSKWRKLKREHKNNLQAWIKVGKIYYENKRYDEARKLKDEGLKTITDKTMQIDLIVKFAIFEFTYGDSSQGETLFETIVQSDPKRVNVWSTYIDQLVKKNYISLARRVLDRAVGNKIPFRKMRTLYKKYYQFEKQHGDAEKQAYVEKLAKEYAFSVSAL